MNWIGIIAAAVGAATLASGLASLYFRASIASFSTKLAVMDATAKTTGREIRIMRRRMHRLANVWTGGIEARVSVLEELPGRVQHLEARLEKIADKE